MCWNVDVLMCDVQSEVLIGWCVRCWWLCRCVDVDDIVLYADVLVCWCAGVDVLGTWYFPSIPYSMSVFSPTRAQTKGFWGKSLKLTREIWNSNEEKNTISIACSVIFFDFSFHDLFRIFHHFCVKFLIFTIFHDFSMFWAVFLLFSMYFTTVFVAFTFKKNKTYHASFHHTT